MKYVCEICNQQFNTVEEAKHCELEHKKEKIYAAAKASASAKISDAVNAYVAKYNELPEIELIPDNQKLLVGTMVDTISDTFAMLIDMFTEDNDNDCDTCKCDECGGHCKNSDKE